MGGLFELIGSLIQLAIFAAIVLGIIAFFGYNKLRRMAEDAKEAISNIKLAIGNKAQILNDLSSIVLRYHQDEQLMVLKISEDLAVSSLQSMYQQTGAVLSTIQGIAQRYPELKSNAQFDHLMSSVEQADGKIHDAQRHYNSIAKDYNVRRGSFPTLLYAGVVGFGPAQYLDFDSAHPNAGQSATLISDDGERVRQIMGVAGAKALEAGRTLAHHGRELAERTVQKVQSGNLGLGAGEEFTYLDENQKPQGPMSREELDNVFRAGRITVDTKVLKSGGKAWVTYREL